MKIHTITSKFLAASALLVSGALFAQVPDQSTPPDVLIKMVVTEVMAMVKADPDIQKGNIPKVVDLVEKKIVPYTDMRRTTEMAMGPNWISGSDLTVVITSVTTILIRASGGVD